MSPTPSRRRPHFKGDAQSFLECSIEHFDREPGAYAERLQKRAHVYHGKRVPMTGAIAKASTFVAGAYASVFGVHVNGPSMEAGVHASVFGLGAYACADLARAEASALGMTARVGVSMTTGISAGVGGVSAHFLGTGFSFGRTVSVSTPIAAFSLRFISLQEIREMF